jgi:hypothetical protein
MSHLTMIPFTPLQERVALENPELMPGLDQLKVFMGAPDFDKYINSLHSLRRVDGLLLLITGKTMYYSIIESKFLPMLKESFGVTKVRIISQG